MYGLCNWIRYNHSILRSKKRCMYKCGCRLFSSNTHRSILFSLSEYKIRTFSNQNMLGCLIGFKPAPTQGLPTHTLYLGDWNILFSKTELLVSFVPFKIRLVWARCHTSWFTNPVWWELVRMELFFCSMYSKCRIILAKQRSYFLPFSNSIFFAFPYSIYGIYKTSLKCYWILLNLMSNLLCYLIKRLQAMRINCASIDQWNHWIMGNWEHQSYASRSRNRSYHFL